MLAGNNRNFSGGNFSGRTIETESERERANIELKIAVNIISLIDMLQFPANENESITARGEQTTEGYTKERKTRYTERVCRVKYGRQARNWQA
jgi:hypothetical protein